MVFIQKTYSGMVLNRAVFLSCPFTFTLILVPLFNMCKGLPLLGFWAVAAAVRSPHAMQ